MNDDYLILGNSSTNVSVPEADARIADMDHMDRSGVITKAAPERTLIRSQTPSIYVPRRFRIGGLPGIRHGAAIVGTSQGDGLVAIDVQMTRYVDPTPEIWGTWVAEAADQHANEALTETTVVSDHDLVEVGRYEDGCVLVDEAGRASLSMWIEAGRTAYVADGLPEFA